MSDLNNQMDDSAKQAARTGRQAAQFAKNAAKKGAKSAAGSSKMGIAVKLLANPIGLIIIALLVLVVLAIFLGALFGSGTSQSQMDNTYSLTPSGNEKVNKPEDEEKSKMDIEYTREQTIKLLDVIADFKEEDKKVVEQELRAYLSSHGYDVEISMQHLTEEVEVPIDMREPEPPKKAPEGESENKEEENYKIELTGASPSELDQISIVEQKKVKEEARLIENVLTKEESGAFYYRGLQGKDLLVAMPSGFGGNGKRFEVVLKNGRKITVMKAATLNSANHSDYISTSGTPFSVIVKKKKGFDLSKVFPGDGIKSINRINQSFNTNELYNTSEINNRILSCFSIFTNNGQLIKKGPLKYVNQNGIEIPTYVFGKNAGKIKYEKALKGALKEFVKKKDKNGKPNHFYATDFKRTADGSIYVGTVDKGHFKEVKRNGKTQKVWVPDIRRYVCPIIIEKDINVMAEDVFFLDLDEVYVNSGGQPSESYLEDEKEKAYRYTRTGKKEIKETPKLPEKRDKNEPLKPGEITIREAIISLSENTNAILFDGAAGSYEGEIFMSELSGTFEWPTPGVYFVSSPFNMGGRRNPVTGRIVPHEGIDIAGPSGSKIVAVEKGTILFAGTFQGYGNYIKIDHGNGVTSAYGHLNSIGVRKGQAVEKGEYIGQMGSTGRSTGPHLHIEIRVNGKPVDPLSYIVSEQNKGKLKIDRY